MSYSRMKTEATESIKKKKQLETQALCPGRGTWCPGLTDTAARTLGNRDLKWSHEASEA